MKEEATELTGKTKKESPALSKEDQKIKQLEDRRKELRKKKNRQKVEYSEVSKTMGKKAQAKITQETNTSC